MDEYISQLSNSLLASFQENDNIQIKSNIEVVRMHIDYAIPIGLIINEMITNSLKHAFKLSKKGIISLTLSTKGNKINFKMSDNGTGFNQNHLKETGSFGTDLIEILVNQIGGNMKLSSDNGVSYEISFNLEDT
jgi:two-component sensor histidine kinase